MPDQNPPSQPDGVRADGPDDLPTSGVAFSAWTKTVPTACTAISFNALKWLVMRAGRTAGSYGGIPTPLTPAFFRRIDQDEPIAIVRAHLEPVVRPVPERRGDVLVALCSFAPAAGGPRLINELVCDPGDYLRVASGATLLPAWSREEYQSLKMWGTFATDLPAPPEALPEGVAGVVRPDGSVVLAGAATSLCAASRSEATNRHLAAGMRSFADAIDPDARGGVEE